MPLDLEVREAAASRWVRWMQLGDFESAWRESELIDRTGYKDPHKLWNGQSWSGRRVMLRCLHGLGDTIQFIRYAPLLQMTCRSLTVQCHPELVRLMQGASGVDRAVTWEQGEEDWDIQLEVTELPRIFQTSISSIPSSVPYLYLAKEQLGWAAERFGRPCRLRVGLIWQSSGWNPKRSIPPSDLEPLLSNNTCDFYTLQKGAQVAVPALDIQQYAKDVSDTAALMTQLDLVITVDTMTAHLAGALGIPVWILLPRDADWRWMLERRDSPWYPSARLFRQKREGDWKAVIEQVLERLLLVVTQSGGKPASEQALKRQQGKLKFGNL